MADKTETITLLPHPFKDDVELVDQDSRTEGTSQGKDVWKLVARVPWTPYPVTYLTYPRTDTIKPTIGEYQVELNRVGARRGKEGSSADYDYFWNAITWKFLGEQEVPAPSSNGGQAPGRSITTSTGDERKDRSVAISYAKDLCVAGIIDRSELFEVAAKMFDTMQDGFTEEE